MIRIRRRELLEGTAIGVVPVLRVGATRHTRKKGAPRVRPAHATAANTMARRAEWHAYVFDGFDLFLPELELLAADSIASSCSCMTSDCASLSSSYSLFFFFFSLFSFFSLRSNQQEGGRSEPCFKVQRLCPAAAAKALPHKARSV